MKTAMLAVVIALSAVIPAALAEAKTRLPKHVVGLWCKGADDSSVSYLRNDASAPEPDTPCKKYGPTRWIEISADGSYTSEGAKCKATKITVVYRGDVIGGEPGANAVYGVDARCTGRDGSWRENARMEVERWGSALTIIRRVMK